MFQKAAVTDRRFLSAIPEAVHPQFCSPLRS